MLFGCQVSLLLLVLRCNFLIWPSVGILKVDHYVSFEQGWHLRVTFCPNTGLGENVGTYQTRNFSTLGLLHAKLLFDLSQTTGPRFPHRGALDQQQRGKDLSKWLARDGYLEKFLFINSFVLQCPHFALDVLSLMVHLFLFFSYVT